MTQGQDWRQLCAELAGWIERSTRHYIQDPDVLIRAYAALDEPVVAPARPTDEELREVWCEGWNTSEEYGAFKFARAVLARYGHQPAPPAAGEVGELVEFLRVWATLCPPTDKPSKFTRAADLLEQRHPAPVPVSERLPGPEDCDGEGRCWVHQPHEACPESPAWELMLAKYASANYEAVCWLPATALPLPAAEVQP